MNLESEAGAPQNWLLAAFDQVAGLAYQAGMSHDARVLATLRLLASRPPRMEEVRERVSNTLQLIRRSPVFQAQLIDKNPFQPYPRGGLDGPIRLGLVMNPLAEHPLPFGLQFEELNQNLLAFGRAGAGKTTLLFHLVRRLLNAQIPFLVIDFKRDYRHLIRQVPELNVFTAKTFRFNPLAPPHDVDPSNWIQIFAEVFSEAFYQDVPFAAKSSLIDLLHDLFDRFHKKHGDEMFPSLFDLEREMTSIAASKGHALRSRVAPLLTRLRPLLRSLEPMLACQKGYSLEDLLQLPVVLELDGCASETQQFLLNILFYAIFLYRMQHVQRGSLRHVLLFDEAKMVFARDKVSPSSTITRLVSQARELGEAVVCADQMPSALSHGILANVFTMIGLSLSAAKDIQAMGAAMGLSTEQRAYLNQLPVGIGVVKMAARHPSPFLIRIPDFN